MKELKFYLQVKISKVEVIENLNTKIKFKNLVITYCLDGDINSNGNYQDRYFSMSSSNNADTLWALILVDNKVKVPKKIDLSSLSGGGNIKDIKLKFTKIFFESSLNYMEAQFHLFNALEMNDEAGKTRKSIDFVKK